MDALFLVGDGGDVLDLRHADGAADELGTGVGGGVGHNAVQVIFLKARRSGHEIGHTLVKAPEELFTEQIKGIPDGTEHPVAEFLRAGGAAIIPRKN